MLAGFFRTLATIFLVWFVFRWLDRVFGGSRRKRQFDAGRPPRSGRQETDGSSKKKKPKDDSIGDYVDFEEVSEDK